MNTHRTTPSRIRLVFALSCLLMGASQASAGGSWAFAPSAYTHDPQTGVRVVQYAEHEPVEGLPDPRQTVSRYWRTRTNLRGADGSSDTIYEVRSFGNTLGGFDAQRERGFDAQLETLDALTPFRRNPYLFFGGLQGFGYGTPGYPAAVPGTPVPGPQGYAPHGYAPQGYAPQQGSMPQDAGQQGAWRPPMAAPQTAPYPGMPGTAYPYAPPTGFVAPAPYYGYVPQWWGYGPGRRSYVPGW